jgi:hypothetical protein
MLGEEYYLARLTVFEHTITELAKQPDCFSVSSLLTPMLILRLLRLFVTLSLMSNCQSTGSYKITLKDGRQYLCRGKPEFVSKTGYYRYKTFQDRDALLRADEVLMIEEQGA